MYYPLTFLWATRPAAHMFVNSLAITRMKWLHLSLSIQRTKNRVDSAHEEQVWRFQAIDPLSVQGPPADPTKVRCGGGLPTPGELLIWHYEIPLIALKHGVPLTFEGSMATHTDQFNTAIDAMARDLASRSSKGQLRIAKKSGHDIMLDEPWLVVQAIHDVRGATF
jgi:hypothetical protein